MLATLSKIAVTPAPKSLHNFIEVATPHMFATGTRPVATPHEKAWTSDDIFPLKGTPPKSITMVGGGFIACELANFFAAVGVETKLLVRDQHILGNEDEEIATIFKEQFIKHVDVAFDTSIKAIAHDGEMFTLTLENKNGEQTEHTSQALLYAILGFHLIGPQSATMMHQVLSIMHLDNDIQHLKEMLYIHPALSEALLPAAVKAVGAVKAHNKAD